MKIGERVRQYVDAIFLYCDEVDHVCVCVG